MKAIAVFLGLIKLTIVIPINKFHFFYFHCLPPMEYTLSSLLTKFSSAMKRETQLDFTALIILIMISITPEFRRFCLAQQGPIN